MYISVFSTFLCECIQILFMIYIYILPLGTIYVFRYHYVLINCVIVPEAMFLLISIDLPKAKYI